MVEGSAQLKNDEQFPLLMVAGAGDGAVPVPTPVVPSLWSNTNTVQHRHSWIERWPEYLSTCWMTFILLGISLLVFYAIGMLVIYKHDTFLLVKCNETKPASGVYYHDLIPRGADFPLTAYSSYLANVAIRYPSLRFNVIFLIDDSLFAPPSKRSFYIYSKLYPYTIVSEEYNVNNRREVRDFQRKYPNVNITTMFLSKFMSMTPLKYKWKTIPTPYLPFYARVFSVWLNGGIGIDLPKQNRLFIADHYNSDRKTSAIMKQHNDGITAKGYLDTLNRIERDEETEFLSTFFNMIQNFFNNTLPFAFPGDNSISVDEQSLIRTHRNKRDISEKDLNIVTNNVSKINTEPVINIVLANTSVVNDTENENTKNIYKIAASGVNVTEVTTNLINPNNDSTTRSETIPGDYFFDQITQFKKHNTSAQKTKWNKTEMPQIVFFYDFSIVSQTFHPELEPQWLDMRERRAKSESDPPKFITIESDGTLVAATAPLHSFLAEILSAGYNRLHPKLAIQNTFQKQCSGIYWNDNYCNYIQVL